jgi:uncharacterized membrane protein YedE/YeeE
MPIRLPALATAALSGALFGSGLCVSQMVDPLKVLRFLDFTAIPSGGWDPSLAFVIVPAIVVMFIAVRIGRRRQAPLFDTRFHEPEYNKVDARLVTGAALFGIGWGMSGICPGPALALVAFQPDGIWMFVAALFAGSLAGSVIIPSGRMRRLEDARS